MRWRGEERGDWKEESQEEWMRTGYRRRVGKETGGEGKDRGGAIQ